MEDTFLSARVTLHEFKLIYPIPLVHHPKGVLLVYIYADVLTVLYLCQAEADFFILVCDCDSCRCAVVTPQLPKIICGIH